MKGGRITEKDTEKVLFSKYKIISILHVGTGSRVYLTEHIDMHAKRVIKEVVKETEYKESFYSEKEALMEINHSNIPTIYDIYEDDDYYYLVEEYIEGVSLFEYVMSTESKRITEEKAIEYGLQLTNLINYLHTLKPNPIIFLDLQPKNIIISDDTLYIIDFGSCIIQNSFDRKNIFGTVGYASPEQYSGKNIGLAADIFGIGAVLLFMVTGNSLTNGKGTIHSIQNISQKFKKIILRCIDVDEECRFENAEKIFIQLKLLKERKITRNTAVNGNSLIISVAGTERKVGTTHIAMLMCKYLSDLGYSVAYEENNTSNHIRKFAKFHNEYIYSDGVFKGKDMHLIPKYSENVLLEFPYDIVIRDEGIYSKNQKYGDYMFLICGSSEWEIYNILESDTDMEKADEIIFNLCTLDELKQITKKLKITGQIMHYLPMEKGFDKKDQALFYNLFEEVIKNNGTVCQKKKQNKRKLFGK